MDRIINSNTEKQTIYEIYRACRLCGAGAGYKMPIIQNVVDLDASGIELTQKIRDCVQIEVHPDDKMPPLICELCVDKVNDFYEFVELCQRTNKRTRMRLGLPPQNPSRVPSSDASSNSGDCILGVTEPVYQNDDSDEPLAPVTRRSKQPEVKKVKKVVSSKQKRPPTPPRSSRAKGSSEDTISLSSLKQQQAKKSSVKVETPQPKSILKKSKEREIEKPKVKVKREDTPPPVRSKRSREAAKPEVPQKKVKLSVPVKPPEFACVVCALSLRSSQALTSHVRCHTVQYTNPELACNACSEWFSSPEETLNHHTQHRVKHRPYRCRRCRGRYSSAQRYTEHIATSKCVPWPEVPDKKCPSCWRLFPTSNLLRLHHCGGEDNRPGGKCSNCKRVYSLLKNQKKHEAICMSKKKGSSEIKVDPDVKARIKPVQVRISRCDGLLETQNDVSRVPKNYGLDRRCVYPYLSTVKSQLCLDSMVSIKTELDDIEDEEFIHWDSSSDSEGKTTVDSLTTLSLKKIFSKKCLGKVARKRRKVKLEFEGTMKRDIENIINNFDNEDSWDNGNNGSDEESLLTNYVPFDETVSNMKADVEDSNDSQSILDLNAGAKNDENSKTEASDTVGVDKNSDESGIETDENINKEGLNSRERLDKDSEESARKTEDKTNEDVSTEDGLSNRVSDKDSECGTETADKVNSELENSEKDVTEISRVSVIRENNDSRSNDVDTDSTGISNDNDAKTENNTEVSNDDSRESNNDKSNNDNRTEPIADFNHVDSVENKPEERTNTDNVDLDNENSNNDCKDVINNRNNSSTVDTKNDNSMEDDTNDSTLNNDSGNTNNDQENTNDYENTNNDNENTNNDHENTNNDHENTNNAHENTINDHENTINDHENTNNDNERISDTISAKTTNGEVEEKSDKLSFGDMNDISDTEVDDKKLMDDLNEHIGEDNKNNDESNENNDFESQNQNGANNDVTNACEDRENLTDHERAINDLISENNEKSNYNHVADSNDKVAENNDVNDYEADKISLEDLLPPKSDAKSMDLDSISDDEFDFDAC
ncbi:putative uncharacterized protein DDB_G0282133 isoform X2 [Ostrinia furnacalis]|uniref:putative uncharacterized protein DDB_G0282133 isoform X2 n=1 Tax=Ostrinia furnacalis TaxID=93504 RepID=UPI00103CE692|nr:putative uncharacterized protein DDB_G0282133 isoform X2 [Ostrinia furnacalis]